MGQLCGRDVRGPIFANPQWRSYNLDNCGHTSKALLLLTFLHISDTHISTDPDYDPHWLRHSVPHPNRGVESLLEAIQQLPFNIDFILHTGDVCAEPPEENYHLALDYLRSLEQPLFMLPGNHDSADMMREVLSDGDQRRVLGDECVTIKGYHLLTIDGSEAEDPLAPTLAEKQIEGFGDQLSQTQGDPVLVAAHYPLIKTGVPWIDDSARIQNGERIHDLLAPHHDRVVGGFFGHIHQVANSTCDGITYTCCPSTWFGFTGFPGMQAAGADLDTPGGFNLVMIRDNRSFVRRYGLPRLVP